MNLGVKGIVPGSVGVLMVCKSLLLLHDMPIVIIASAGSNYLYLSLNSNLKIKD